MRKVLITGVSGFVGSHLADYLLTMEDIQVYGTIRHRSNWDNILHIKNKMKVIDCNIVDAISVMQVIKGIKPDYIFHLAAQSFVPTSWKAPQDTLQTNIIGTVNILEAVREYIPECKVLVIGSSEEYGKVYENEIPIRESNPLRPLSPYGVSKVTQDLLAQQYHKSYGLNVYISRAFNHEGPRRGEVFVTSDFAKQIVEIENDKRSIILVGNLDAIRDFTDVRDIVRAYWILVNKGVSGFPYNICSGEGTKIGDLLKMLISISEIFDFTIVQDEDKMRPSDVPILIGECSAMHTLGWERNYSLNQTLTDILDYWRGRA